MTGIIFYKIETFVVLMLLGLIAAKIGLLKKENLSVLSGLLVKIAFPCLGFALIYDAGLSLSQMFTKTGFLLAELSLSAFLFVVGILSAKLCRLQGSTKNVHIIQTMFGNQGFMNIPILLALYTGGEANAYITIFTLVDQILLWSLGVVILSSNPDSKNSAKTSGKDFLLSMLKKVLNPMIVCMLLAIVLTSLHIKLPEALSSTISTVGNTSFSWALIFLGASLSYVSFQKLGNISSYIFLVVVKMLLIPVCVGVISRHFLSETESVIITLMAAMPAMSAISMMAQNYNSDADYASRTILIMTVSSILTIPLVFYFVNLF